MTARSAAKNSGWLSERRRASTALGVAVLLAMALVVAREVWDLAISPADAAVVLVAVYLAIYLVITYLAFSSAPHSAIRAWAAREGRGSWLERYVLGTAPGPGVSIFIAMLSVPIAIIWMPGTEASYLDDTTRITLGVVTLAIGWVCTLVSFTVTFLADNLVENGTGLEFPGSGHEWSSYVYFATSVMTTFGTTDVTVASEGMRRTVAANAIVAFVFNTVIVASAVALLT